MPILIPKPSTKRPLIVLKKKKKKVSNVLGFQTQQAYTSQVAGRYRTPSPNPRHDVVRR